MGTVGKAPTELELRYTYDDLKPVAFAPYSIRFNDGTTLAGQLDENGYARIENPPDAGKVYFGYDQREAFPVRQPPTNPIQGFVPDSPESAQAALKAYREQETEYLTDNYFPDEIAAIDTGSVEFDDMINDYEYAEDSQPPIEASDESPDESHKEVMLNDDGESENTPEEKPENIHDAPAETKI